MEGLNIKELSTKEYRGLGHNFEGYNIVGYYKDGDSIVIGNKASDQHFVLSRSFISMIYDELKKYGK